METFLNSRFIKRFSTDIAIDLGTLNSCVVADNSAFKFSEPSFVAFNHKKRQIIAIGAQAKSMQGRTPPDIRVVRPIKGGVIGNFEMACALIEYLLKRIKTSGLIKPRIMAAVPHECSEIERRAIQESLRLAGARVVYLIEQTIASAIGSDIPIMEANGGIIVDLGASQCRVALISLGGIVEYRDTLIAGLSMDEAVSAMLASKYKLLVGALTAEELKKQLGSAVELEQKSTMLVKGRDVASGLPAAREIAADDVYQAIADLPLKMITETVKGCIENTPHGLISDVIDKGITISGGIAYLRGLDRLLSERLNIKCKIAPEPLFSVAKGMERIMSDPHLMKSFFSNSNDRISEN